MIFDGIVDSVEALTALVHGDSRYLRQMILQIRLEYNLHPFSNDFITFVDLTGIFYCRYSYAERDKPISKREGIVIRLMDPTGCVLDYSCQMLLYIMRKYLHTFNPPLPQTYFLSDRSYTNKLTFFNFLRLGYSTIIIGSNTNNG